MKPIRDTKLGQFLKDKAPKVLNIVGDLLPEKGVLGIVKNLISTDPEVAPEAKAEFLKMEHQFELDMLKAENEDRSSARSREIEFIKATGRADYFQYFIGTLAVVLMCTVTLLLVYYEIPTKNEHVLILIIGELLGFVGGIYTYHYGSSMGSRLKDMRKKD